LDVDDDAVNCGGGYGGHQALDPKIEGMAGEGAG